MEPPDRQSIDLTMLQVPDGHRYKVSIEKGESPQELRLRLIRELVVLPVATIFVIAIGGICLAVVLGDTSSPDDRKWAFGILSGIAGGCVGHLLQR